MAFNKLIFVFFSLVCIVLISIVLLDAKFNFSASFRQLLPFQQLEIKGTKGNMLGILMFYVVYVSVPSSGSSYYI